MWIFTELGFFSAVQDMNNSAGVMVRARCEEDIQDLAGLIQELGWDKPEILSNVGTDYKYRVFIQKDVWKDVLEVLAMNIVYPNFKYHVHGDPDRDRAYMKCWNAMYEFQESKL